MYSSRRLNLAILMLAPVFLPSFAVAEPSSPEASPPAAETESPAKVPKQAKQQSSGDKPAEPRQPAVAWDASIEEVASARYPKTVQQLRRLQDQVQSVVQHARPAVVAVQNGDAVGSGVIVSEDGLVLTAGHVATKPNRPVRFMFPDGSRARGTTLGLNRTIDSGMMKITDKGPWPHVKTAKSGELDTGDWVICLGQPNGYFRDRAPPVRLGRVLYQDDEVINTDCTLVGGDSGGPLFNLKGEVVGIHSRIGRRITSNFHVPISTYELTWARLLAGEMWGGGIGEEEQPVRSRPLLGVAGNPTRSPCLVTQVFPGMPAQRAGVEVGDVIIKFGEKDVANFRDLGELVMRQKPMSRVTITIEREGKPLEIKVRLSSVPVEFPGAPPLESSLLDSGLRDTGEDAV